MSDEDYERFYEPELEEESNPKPSEETLEELDIQEARRGQY